MRDFRKAENVEAQIVAENDEKTKLCSSCNLNTRENTRHYLLNCPKYKVLRKKMLENISRVIKVDQKMMLLNQKL